MSFLRSVRYRKPSSSRCPISPVLNHPSGKNASSVRCLSFQYPDVIFLPRRQISPSWPGRNVAPASSRISTSKWGAARPVEPIFASSIPGTMKVSPLLLSVRPYASIYRALGNASAKERIRASGVRSPPPITQLSDLADTQQLLGKAKIMLVMVGANHAPLRLYRLIVTSALSGSNSRSSATIPPKASTERPGNSSPPT